MIHLRSDATDKARKFSCGPSACGHHYSLVTGKITGVACGRCKRTALFQKLAVKKWGVLECLCGSPLPVHNLTPPGWPGRRYVAHHCACGQRWKNVDGKFVATPTRKRR